MTSKDHGMDLLTPEKLVEAARRNSKAGLWAECLASCNQGIDMGDEIDTDSWVALRLGFAAAVIELKDKTAELVERAIKEIMSVAISNRLSVRRQSVSDSTWPLLRDGSRFHPRQLLPPGTPSSSFASYVS